MLYYKGSQRGDQVKANEMWTQFCTDPAVHAEAWCFGADPDTLAKLVVDGIKTATSSAYVGYEIEHEELPKAGEYSIILDSKEEAVCIIQTTQVTILAFNEVSSEHAYKEGENDRSLENWRKVHKAFFERELASYDRKFDESMLVVCEEFKVVYKG